MNGKLAARFVQLRRDLAYLRGATEAIIAGLFFIRRNQPSAGAIIVLVDRRPVWLAIQLGRPLGLLPSLRVYVVRSRDELNALLDLIERTADDSEKTIVVSRLLYAKHYPAFRDVRLRGELVVL